MTSMAEAREMMVDCQIRPSDVTKYAIIRAFLSVPREEFVPRSARSVAYAGMSLPLENGRAVSDPRVLAKCLDALNPSSNDLALCVGGGLGYSAALLSHLCATVVMVEEASDLATDAAASFERTGIYNIIIEENSLTEGAPTHAPYDVMLIDGAVEELPEALLAQLKLGGRVVCVCADAAGAGQCHLGIRTGQGISWRYIFDARLAMLPGFSKKAAFELV